MELAELDRAESHDPIVEAPAFDGFLNLEGALDLDDIAFLISRCKSNFQQIDAIPSYLLIDHLGSECFKKVQHLVQDAVGEEVFYLNDFYIYTDESAQAHWHVDTELFTFERAYNAWILLSPDMAESPLAILQDKNDSNDNYFHAVKVDDGQCKFGNYKNGRSTVETLDHIGSNKIAAPNVTVGDVLLLDPKKFHKTNIKAPKHAIAIKFVAKGGHGFRSSMQVPSMLWPETKVFNTILKHADNWDNVIAYIRTALSQPKERQALSGGFFPERLSLYREKMTEL